VDPVKQDMIQQYTLQESRAEDKLEYVAPDCALTMIREAFFGVSLNVSLKTHGGSR